MLEQKSLASVGGQKQCRVSDKVRGRLITNVISGSSFQFDRAWEHGHHIS